MDIYDILSVCGIAIVILLIYTAVTGQKESRDEINESLERQCGNLRQGNALLHNHIKAQDGYIESLKKELDEFKKSTHHKDDSLEEKIRIIESGRLPPLECCRSESDGLKSSDSMTDDKANIRRLKNGRTISMTF